MDLTDLSLILHLCGFGILTSTIISGWILNRHYARAQDHVTKVALLKPIRTIGILSPLAIVLLLVTGIANMHLREFGVFTQGWLSAKIVLFAIAVVNGIVFGVQSGKRGKLVARMASGEDAVQATAQAKSLDQQIRIFYVVQLLLVLAILFLSVVKPG